MSFMYGVYMRSTACPGGRPRWAVSVLGAGAKEKAVWSLGQAGPALAPLVLQGCSYLLIAFSCKAGSQGAGHMPVGPPISCFIGTPLCSMCWGGREVS